MVSMHSRGAIEASDVVAFVSSVAPTIPVLIPRLMHQGFRVAVATQSDDLYSHVIRDKSKHNYSGARLAREVLRGFLPEAMIDQIPIVTLNPMLYPPVHPTVLNDPLRDFFYAKMRSHGITPSLDRAGISLFSEREIARRECLTYPPKPNKDHHLLMLKCILDIPYSRMILLDDKEMNVGGALQLGASGVLVKGELGLSFSDLMDFQYSGVLSEQAGESNDIDDLPC